MRKTVLLIIITGILLSCNLSTKSDISRYTITFDSNGGTGDMEPLTFSSGAEVTLPENSFTFLGHYFIGWNLASDGSGTNYQNLSTLPLETDITLYAQWSENRYTIIFDPNNGEGKLENQEWTLDSSTILNSATFSRPGYNFLSWNTLADGTGTSYNPGDEIILDSSSITLYAQWTEKEFSIEYNSNGGYETIPDSNWTIATSQVLPSDIITKKGYVFKGWNTLADGTGTLYSPGATINMEIENITLYAHWEISVFISKWKADNLTLYFPLHYSGEYDFEIDWGDGTKERVKTGDIPQYIGNITHVYSSIPETGAYTVTVTGLIHGFGGVDEGSMTLLDITKWGSMKLHNYGNQFCGSIYLVDFSAKDIPKIDYLTNTSNMFVGATNFNGDLSFLDTTNVTNMWRMFAYTDKFNQPLDHFNTSNVTNMRRMFMDAKSFNKSLDNFDTSKVNNMESMFGGAEKFNQSLAHFDVRNVTNFAYMFYNSKSFNRNLSNWSTMVDETVRHENFAAYSVLEEKNLPYASWGIVWH